MTPFERAWNHNTHYHRQVLRQVPMHCERALELGSGDGRFAARLADRSAQVVAIDADAAQAAITRETCRNMENVTVVHGDFLTQGLGSETFDVVTALASLHHAPFEAAMRRVADLLRPGGRLIVLGVWTDNQTAQDTILNHTAGLANKTYQRIWGTDVMDAPARLPDMSFRETRHRVPSLLPGARIRRLLLWRYLLTWDKPQNLAR